MLLIRSPMRSLPKSRIGAKYDGPIVAGKPGIEMVYGEAGAGFGSGRRADRLPQSEFAIQTRQLRGRIGWSQRQAGRST